MKNYWRSVALIISLTFLLLGCANHSEDDESRYVKVSVEKISEQKDVNLEHPLYNRRNWDFSFRDFGLVGKIFREDYEYLQNLTYEKQDIYSAEQALKYYQEIDPWDLIKNYNYVVAEIHYDADYDIWCMILCKENLLEDFLEFKGSAPWWVYFKGDGEFLYRLE